MFTLRDARSDLIAVIRQTSGDAGFNEAVVIKQKVAASGVVKGAK